MIANITTVQDIRTYIANQCGGDDDVQAAMYERVHAAYMAGETPRLGADWSDWFDEHSDRLFGAACRDVAEAAGDLCTCTIGGCEVCTPSHEQDR